MARSRRIISSLLVRTSLEFRVAGPCLPSTQFLIAGIAGHIRDFLIATRFWEGRVARHGEITARNSRSTRRFTTFGACATLYERNTEFYDPFQVPRSRHHKNPLFPFIVFETAVRTWLTKRRGSGKREKDVRETAEIKLE